MQYVQTGQSQLLTLKTGQTQMRKTIKPFSKVSKHNPSAWTLMLLLIFLLVYTGCTNEKDIVNKGTRPVPVITGLSSKQNVEYIIHQVGTIEAKQTVMIRSEIDGIIEQIEFKEGGKVKKGDVLVTLDSAKKHAEIRSLEAYLRQLELRLANKNRTLERNRPLVEQELVSRLYFDDLQTEAEETQAKIEQTNANINLKKEELSDTIVRAPFEGVTGARNISIGHYLKKGDPIVSVVDLENLEISFQVPERYKPRISTGQEIILTVAPFPERKFKWKIFFIAPAIDINTRSFQVKAGRDNRNHLLNPGMFAKVKLITEIHENAVTVPWESVIQNEAETYIYTVKNNIAKKIFVRLGKITDNRAEILEPDIPVGTEVVLEGKYNLKDGFKIILARQ